MSAVFIPYIKVITPTTGFKQYPPVVEGVRSHIFSGDPYWNVDEVLTNALNSIPMSHLQGKVGVFLGSSMPHFDEQMGQFYSNQSIKYLKSRTYPNACQSPIAQKLRAFIKNRVVVLENSNACASGAVALAQAWSMIHTGLLDSALVCAYEFNAIEANAIFDAYGVANTSLDRAKLNGVVVGNGLGLIVLSNTDSRDVKSYISDIYIKTSDRNVTPDADVINDVMAYFNSSVQHIYMHKTGTKKGDAAEVIAANTILPYAHKYASKEQTGHLLSVSCFNDIDRATSHKEQSSLVMSIGMTGTVVGIKVTAL